MKRVFLIVLDSFGIGGMEDAASYGDVNVNTLRTVSASPFFHMPHMRDLGLFQIEGVELAPHKESGLDKAYEAHEESGLDKASEAHVESGLEKDCEAYEESGLEKDCEAYEESGLEKACEAHEESGLDKASEAHVESKLGKEAGTQEAACKAAYARMREASRGKDTTIGHWEIAGVCSPKPLPTYPEGFPEEVLEIFSRETGRGVLCNQPYSGTAVIQKYGDAHMDTGNLIVYTSADSVFQIAAHEEVVPLEQLYEYCRIARRILQGEHGVGRVIARPFLGPYGGPYTRTAHRHDFSILPPAVTMLDQLSEQGKAVIAVGKIYDIFAGKGITESVYTSGNEEGIARTLEYLDRDFEGLCFINLVDYDMLYGHRRDVDGYAKALSYFDERLPEILDKMREEDILMITADHGCDPGYTATTDHTREYTPFLMYGKHVTPGNLGTRKTFADIGATVLQYFGIAPAFPGEGMLA